MNAGGPESAAARAAQRVESIGSRIQGLARREDFVRAGAAAHANPDFQPARLAGESGGAIVQLYDKQSIGYGDIIDGNRPGHLGSSTDSVIQSKLEIVRPLGR